MPGKIIINCLLVLLILSCTKDKINPDCYDFPPPPRGQGYEPVFNDPRLGSVVINPNNTNEILYNLFTEAFGIKDLVKFNLETKEREVIFSGEIFNISWGKNDWILFGLGISPRQIWKIKSNGDSLTQLTYGPSHFQPVWNPEADQFVCSIFDQGSAIYDENGNLIHHFPNLRLNRVNWQRPDFILSHFSTEIYAFYPQDSTIVDIYLPEESINVGNIAFLPGTNEIIWTSRSVLRGIFRTDLDTGTTIKIKENCDSRRYSRVFYDPKLNKIIAFRFTNDLIESTYEHITTELVMMNLDGSEEVVIELPE